MVCRISARRIWSSVVLLLSSSERARVECEATNLFELSVHNVDAKVEARLAARVECVETLECEETIE